MDSMHLYHEKKHTWNNNLKKKSRTNKFGKRQYAYIIYAQGGGEYYIQSKNKHLWYIIDLIGLSPVCVVHVCRERHVERSHHAPEENLRCLAAPDRPQSASFIHGGPADLNLPRCHHNRLSNDLAAKSWRLPEIVNKTSGVLQEERKSKGVRSKISCISYKKQI